MAGRARNRSDGGGATIRTRLLATVITLTALGIALTGGTAYLLERSRVDTAVAEQLSREAGELAALAADGVDPMTGGPFTSASDLLRVALQRRVLPASGGQLAIVDGRVEWLAADGVPVRPEESPALVATVVPLAARDTVTQGVVLADGREWAYVVVPVHASSEAASGALVRVVDLGLERRLLDDTYRTYAVLGLLVLALIGGVTWLVMARLLEPITWVRRTAESISESDLAARIPVRGHDDLSALTRTVNGMLDRIEEAVGGQRRLLDDVGHELRTPLTVIRGHLELLDPARADDVSATRALTLEEVSRMSRLVDDLLLLARAERGDLVTPRPVDIGRLTDETFEKARVLGDHRWVLEELADVECVLDPQRVAQAWLQLAANAVRYSPPGSRVGFGSRAERGAAPALGPGRGHRDRTRGAGGGAAPVRPRRSGTGGPGGQRPRACHRRRDRPGARRPGRHRLPARCRRRRRPRPAAPSLRTRRRRCGCGPGARDADRGGRAMTRVLIVEDEARIADFVAKGLGAAGYACEIAASGERAVDLVLAGSADLVVLDVGLPDIDGFEVLRRLRGQGSAVPVIVLTARSSATDTVAGLEGGADDYMAKPFSFAELLARVRLRLRPAPAGESTTLQRGDLVLDLGSRRVTVAGRGVDLSAREFALAETFLRHPGQVLSREQLLDLVWGYDFDPGSNVVDVYVRYLRSKLGAERIETVRGIGYRLV